MTDKIKILFLCTGNSCRSQMAEGWVRQLHPTTIEAFSAGIEKHGLNPLAVAVMAEAGIDISCQRSKLTAELANISFDYIVTVCDQAAATCPTFSGSGKIIHQSFEDPPPMAATKNTKHEKLECYRKVRDEIKNFVQGLPDNLLAR